MTRAAAWVLGRIPLPLARLCAWALSWIWWLLVPIRRNVAAANLSRAFPELPPGPTLRRTVAEILLGYTELLRHFRDPVHIEWEGVDPIRERHARGEGTLVIGSHSGSWDLAMAAFPKSQEVPLSVFVKPPAQGEVARVIADIRDKAGLYLLPPGSSMRHAYEALDAGHMVIFVMDQRRNQGIPVPFFGQPAWTSPAAAAAHARTGVPVFGCWQWREGTGRHRVRFYGPLELSGDVEDDTARLTRWYEERLRERPHGWLWLHDRWRVPG
ncbi:MAG TPA: lysophospholipid acyltransferase family protein [Myxococcota bacterium]|nr:lysophospholipid acyltransferase family protein [Myxococcota bacterium]